MTPTINIEFAAPPATRASQFDFRQPLQVDAPDSWLRFSTENPTRSQAAVIAWSRSRGLTIITRTRDTYVCLRLRQPKTLEVA